MKVPLVDLKAQYNSIRPQIREAIDRVLEKQKFILDSEAAKFEAEIAQLCGTPYAIGCASGTDALLLSLRALGVEAGDEVITTSFSFFSTAGMISWLNAKPVFVDIDPGTFHLISDQVRSKVNAKTKAIIAVHLFGQCCRMEALTQFEVPVIEDAAQAIGALRREQPAGSMGITGCFSFFPTKNLGAFGDGGVITTPDRQIAEKLFALRAHGERTIRYVHETFGTNSRLDELQAAVLSVKLQHLVEWNNQRRKNAEFYFSNLKGLPLELPAVDPENFHTFHQFVIKTEKRNQLKDFLANKEIATAIYYPIPLPMQPCFADLGYKPGDFPNGERCAASCLALPVYPELSQQQLEYVTSSIHDFFRV